MSLKNWQTKDGSSPNGKKKIFISYRKSDRAYARAVCDEILNVEIDEPVAVWYDIDLEPGKDFKKQINDALGDAQLFVMIITSRSMEPNDEGKDNFMHAVEYPYAESHCIPMLPIQCEDVDMNQYNEMYGNMHMVSWRSDNYKEALTKSMKQVFISKTKKEEIKAAFSEKEVTLRNSYLMGKGYLRGVEVERDVKRGVRNITFAAEEGLLEAAKELSRMYNTGDGVKIDYLEAIEWQKKAVELSRAEYDKAPTYQNAYRCFWEQIYLGDYYNGMAKLTEAENAYTSAGELVQAYYEQDKSNDVLRMISVAYNRAGSVCERRANLSGAEQFYQKGLEIAEQLAKESPTIETRRDLSISYERLAGIKKAQGKLDEAEQLYQQSLDIREQLAKESSTIQARRDLFVSYNKLGGIKEAQKDLSGAEQLYQKDLEIAEQLVKESPTIEARRDLSVSYEKIAGIKKAQGKFDEAEQLYQQSLDIREQLVKESQSPTIQARRDLSISYNKLGGIKEAQKDLSGAEQLYQKYSDISEQLVKESPTIEVLDDLAVSNYNLGRLKSDTGRLEKAQAIWKELFDATGLDIYKQRCDSAMIAILQMQSKLAEEEDSAPDAADEPAEDSVPDAADQLAEFAPAPRKSLFGRKK